MNAIGNDHGSASSARICHAAQLDDLTGRHSIVQPEILLLQDRNHSWINFELLGNASASVSDGVDFRDR